MDRNKINALLCAIITTLDEALKTDSDQTGEGVIYAALMGQVTLDEFQKLMGLLHAGALIDRWPGHAITITPNGRRMAKEIRAFEAAKAKK